MEAFWNFLKINIFFGGGGVALFTQKEWHVPFFETIGRRSGGIDGRAGGRETGN